MGCFRNFEVFLSAPPFKGENFLNYKDVHWSKLTF